MKLSVLPSAVLAGLALAASHADAAVVLADDFSGVSKVGSTATIGGWDTVDGIDAPSTALSFKDGDSASTVGFHNATANEIDVNNNMTAGGWDTSIALVVDAGTASIDLNTLVLDMRLINGSGGPNTTGSKSGRMIAELVGSSSGSLGTVDPGNSGYPSVAYTRTLDLSSLPSLDSSETYTLVIQARGTGHGHHKSLQALELSGDITPVPEPAVFSLLGLAAFSLLRRRR